MDDLRRIGPSIHRLDKLIGRYLFQQANQLGLEDELTSTNARILRYLHLNQGHEIYQKDVEREFGITRSTASRVLALMEQKGFIARQDVEHDGRLKKLLLTDKSRRLGVMMQQNGEATEARLTKGFSDEEREALLGFLERLRKNIE